MEPTIPTDLHGHSLFSDGRATPEEYVRYRAALGFQFVALSDHDTFAGVRRAAATAQRAGLQLIPAMEVTSFIHLGTGDAEQIHVLAYYPPNVLRDGGLERTMLWARAQKVHRRWRRFALDWLDGLTRFERATLDPRGELPGLEGAEFPALQSFINLIAQRQRMVFESFRRHHVRFWTEDPDLFGWTPEEAIDVIRADGALDVVAHPVRVRDKARMDAVLDYASGLEVYTSRHKDTVAARFRAYAEERGKLWTASSDDHQHSAYVHPRSGTPRQTIQRILMGPPAAYAGAARTGTAM